VFGINGAEFIVLLVVAVVVIGPERLPRYAEQLGSFVRSARGYLRDAKARVDAEIGDEISDVDWSKLDPRQYDPRRIVREALLDDEPVRERVAPPPPRAASPAPQGGSAPFDDEAT